MIIIIIIFFFFFFLILIIFIIHHDGHDHQALSCIKHANVAWRVYPAHLFLFTLSLHLEVRSAASEQLRHTKPCPLLLWADAKDSMLFKEQPDLFPRTMNSKYVFIYKPLSAFTHAFVFQYFHSYFMAVFCTIDWFRSYSYSLLLKNIQTWSPLGAISEGRMPHHSLINGHHRKIPRPQTTIFDDTKGSFDEGRNSGSGQQKPSPGETEVMGERGVIGILWI